jgi:hypothetical protein
MGISSFCSIIAYVTAHLQVQAFGKALLKSGYFFGKMKKESKRGVNT